MPPPANSPVHALLRRHPAPAVDDVLLESLRLGEPPEQLAIVETLLVRRTAHGLAGLVAQFATLPDTIRRRLVARCDMLAPAVSRCARADTELPRVSAARFIGEAGSARLIYILGELLRSGSSDVFGAACEATAALADSIWCAADDLRQGRLDGEERGAIFDRLVAIGSELEPLVLRALDAPRGSDSPGLARAAVQIMAVRRGPLCEAMRRHGGRPWPLVSSRLARPSDAAAVAALLACAGRGPLRQEIVARLAAADAAEALPGLVDHAYRLVDPALQSAALAGRGRALSEQEIRVLRERSAGGAARAALWLAHGTGRQGTEVTAEAVWKHAGGCGVSLLRSTVDVPGAHHRLATRILEGDEERAGRMAARVLARAGEAGSDRILLRRLASAPPTVRATIARRIGARSFHLYWERFDLMMPEARQSAGRALFKMLPQELARLKRLLVSGTPNEAIKALCVASELGIAQQVRDEIRQLCEHGDAKVRSKAVLMIGELLAEGRDAEAEQRLEAALVDADDRVRANAIEVLERTGRRELASLLEARSRLGRNRERANAIRAMARMRLADPQRPLFDMLRDRRDPHRLSALWAVEQTGQWKLLEEVVRLARSDSNSRVRRYALGTVQRMAEQMRRPAAA